MDFDHYLDLLREVYEAQGGDLVLRDGATPDELDQSRNSPGAHPSNELAAAWTRCNGSQTPVFARPGFFTGYRFLSVAESLAEREAARKRAATYGDYVQEEARDHRIRDGWFHEEWIPFAGFGGGTLLLMEDHSPNDAGKPGQIIGYVHDPDEIVFVSDSFAEFLSDSIKAIADDPEEYGLC